MLSHFIAMGVLAAQAHLPTAPAEPTIDDLAFLTGSWRGTAGPMTVEEVWLEPSAGNMTGVFRLAGANGVSLVEIMTITETDAGLIYRLRHFDVALVPWASEVNGPVEATTTLDGSSRVVFTPIDEEAALPTITYELSDDDVLVATVEYPESSGQDPFVLRFERAEP